MFDIKKMFVFDQSALIEKDRKRYGGRSFYYNYFLWVGELVKLQDKICWKMIGKNSGFFTSGKNHDNVIWLLEEHKYVDILFKYRTLDVYEEMSYDMELWKHNDYIYYNFTESDLTEFIDYDEFYNKMVASDRPGGHDYSWIKGLQRRFAPNESTKRVLSR